MLGISIDLGTYSVKLLNFHIERKKIKFLHADEIVLDYQDQTISRNADENDDHLHKNKIIWELQIKAIKEYLSHLNTDYSFLLNIPSDLISTRLLEIPIKNKKKAALMLPFQIEEDLPFPISACHYAEALEVQDDKTHALVGIIKKENFEIYYNDLVKSHITPKVLTFNSSIYENYIREHKDAYPNSFCIIELGHTGSRGFYFCGGKLVSVHQSHLAGKSITEAIAKQYNINYDEAVMYKHQNSFLLTKEQQIQVNKNQKDFAILMDATLAPLLHDINRWNIGFRVKFQDSINDVYICGGSANIKNIKNYLESNLNLSAKELNTFSNTNAEKLQQEAGFHFKFAQSSALAQAAIKKSKLANFLNSEFNIQGDSDLPIHSFAFIGTRAAMLTLLICLSIMIEGFFLKRDVKNANNAISATLKNPILKINGRLRRSVNKKPLPILSKLKKSSNLIKQEIRVIQSAVKTNALDNLNFISTITSGFEVEITSFHSLNDGDYNATLTAEKLEILEKLSEHIKNTENSRIYADLNKKNKTLTLSGEEEK